MTSARQRISRSRAAIAFLAIFWAAGPIVVQAQSSGAGDIPASIRVRVYMVVDRQSGLPGLDVSYGNIKGLLDWANDFHPGLVDVFEQTNPANAGYVNPQGILDYFRDLPDVRPTDVLVFYYAGHGATDPRPGKGHWLSTSGGAILRSSIRDAMQARNPRLCILLTDCCSSVSQAPTAVAYAAAPYSATPRDRLQKILDDLFLRSTGVTDWTAATYDATTRVGEYAWFNYKGGLFTDGLYTTLTRGVDPKDLDLDHDGFVSWAEFGTESGRTIEKSYQQISRYYLSLDPSQLSDAMERDVYFKIVNQPHQTIQRFSDGLIAPPTATAANP